MYVVCMHVGAILRCFPIVFPRLFLYFPLVFWFLLSCFVFCCCCCCCCCLFFIILIGGARGLRMTQIEKLQASIAEWQVTRSGKKSNEIQFIYIYVYIIASHAYELLMLRFAAAWLFLFIIVAISLHLLFWTNLAEPSESVCFLFSFEKCLRRSIADMAKGLPSNMQRLAGQNTSFHR